MTSTRMAIAEAIRMPPLPSIRDIIRMYRLRAVKQLSQNFLMDEKLTNKIVKSAGRISNGYVCEVGPGPGSVTRSILRKGIRKLIVIEKDRRFLPSLEMLAEACQGHMSIVIGDVMSYNFEKTFPDECRKDWEDETPNVNIIGNLPFNVSTHLIIRWLHAMSEKRNAWSYGRVPLTLTFQKEVAERMVADIMSPQRCRLSIMCQYLCRVEHRFTIPGRAFIPKPEVDVGVVHFVPLREPKINVPFQVVEKVVRNIFQYRRKESYKGASELFPMRHRTELARELFQKADVSPMIVAYHLTIEEFNRLCSVYYDISKRMPSIHSYNHRGQNSEEDIELLDKEVDEEIKRLEEIGLIT